MGAEIGFYKTRKPAVADPFTFASQPLVSMSYKEMGFHKAVSRRARNLEWLAQRQGRQPPHVSYRGHGTS